MKFGVGINTCREVLSYPAGFSGPKEMVEIAQLAERLGFYSVWGDEHIAPTRSMMERDSQPPNFYELFVSLAFVAGSTNSIKIGAGVLCIPWRDPVWIAKQASTLDVASNGRFIMAVGLGALKEELVAIKANAPKYNRGHMLDEGLEAINILFSEKWASYQGEYYHFENVAMFPKPLQKPFPIFISGEKGSTFERIARWGSGFFVTPKLELMQNKIETLKPYLERYNRTITDVEVTTITSLSIAQTHEEAVERWESSRIAERYRLQGVKQADEINFIGTPNEVTEKIMQLEKGGLGHCGLQRFAASSHSEIIEQIQMMGEEVLPHFR
jgi:probable F420-dependent oxidoreductase